MKNSPEINSKFDTIITNNTKWYDLSLGEIWKYKDLIYFFVKRDFVAVYKQTLLGPLWYLIQPLFTSLVMILVFTKIAKLDTGSIPPILFYLSGNILWMYFSDNIIRTSDTFIINSSIFGKVYFPRLTVPISTTISGLIAFGIQYILFISFYIYYYLIGTIQFNILILTLPFIILYLSIQSFSFGIIISSLTTKYRDLKFLLKFGLQLWFYASPIAYSIDLVPQKYLDFYLLNPIVFVIEYFRYIHFGLIKINVIHFEINFLFTIFIFITGVIMFHKVEKSFIDTV